MINQNKTAAIILAAGESKRFGKPKQLLDWFGKSFINQVIDTARKSNLDPIIVVLGSSFVEISDNISVNRDVIVVENRHWGDGQSTSLIEGIKNLADNNDSFIFFLCDQPQIPDTLCLKIVSEYRNHKNDIVITEVNGQKLPPILFDKCCIDDLNNLIGDQGGKSLLKSHPTTSVDWKDARLLLDVDTIEQYKELISKYEK